MLDLLDSGLRNDNVTETFSVRSVRALSKDLFQSMILPQAPTQPASLPDKVPKSHPHPVLGSELQLLHLVPFPSWRRQTRSC